MAKAEMKFVRTVRAWETETVEIVWRCEDGSAYYQQVTIPPKATREVQRAAEQERVDARD